MDQVNTFDFVSHNRILISDWLVRFLQERIEVAKYCSQDQIEMYSDLLQRSLDIQVSWRTIFVH